MLQLRPGSGVGPFELGMTSRAAIELIRNENRNADIVYEAADPNSQDLVLRVPSVGACLRFEPLSQRLRLIDLFELDVVRQLTSPV
jgi:hypothetical protein